MNAFNSVAAQRNRIMDFLRIRPLDTLTARKELDIMHPAARVMELRKRGFVIETIKIDRPSDCGGIHRVACYALVAGVVAPAPANKADGIRIQKTDQSENSMEGSL